MLFIALNIQCNAPYRILFGIKNPNKAVSKKQIGKAIRKYKLNDFEHLYANDSIKSIFYTNHLSVNSVVVFDDNGNHIKLKNETYCSNDYTTLTEVYNDSSYVEIDSSIIWQKIAKFSKSLHTVTNDSINFSKSTHTIILTWARYAGILNKINSKLWSVNLKSHKGVKVYYLNIDNIKN